MRRLAAFAAILVPAAVALRVLAADAPHDASQIANAQSVSCKSCHTLHNAPGATLTSVAGNAALCASCHTTTNFGFPYNTTDQAVAAGGGLHHRWDTAVATTIAGADFGTANPTNASVLGQLNGNGGVLNCSVCHDPHKGASANGPGAAGSGLPHATQHLSAVTKVPTTSTGTLTASTVDAAASPRGYLLKISPDATHFILSNDGGTSWWCWSGSAWTLTGCTGSPVTGPGQSTTVANVALNDPAGAAYVKITFGGTPAVGDTFAFYVSYPFPREDVSASALCEDCHRSWVMTAAASTGANGTKQFSHPVGDSLVSGRTYDRTGGTPPFGNILDADGSTSQTTGDGNHSNDVRLGIDGTVRCMSCHYPHATDSNSLSQDPR